MAIIYLTKISSRKFIIAVAAFLASLGAGITGISTGDQKLAAVGIEWSRSCCFN